MIKVKILSIPETDVMIEKVIAMLTLLFEFLASQKTLMVMGLIVGWIEYYIFGVITLQGMFEAALYSFIGASTAWLANIFWKWIKKRFFK